MQTWELGDFERGTLRRKEDLLGRRGGRLRKRCGRNSGRSCRDILCVSGGPHTGITWSPGKREPGRGAGCILRDLKTLSARFSEDENSLAPRCT